MQVHSLNVHLRNSEFSWFNINNVEDHILSTVNWDSVGTWEPFNLQESLVATVSDNTEFQKSMMEELTEWKDNNVYNVVDFQNQKLISLRWVHTSKTQKRIKKAKSQLLAKGFQEQNKIKSDSPTCDKESLRLILNIIPSVKWIVQSID